MADEKKLGHSEGLREAAKVIEEIHDLISESLRVLSNLHMTQDSKSDVVNAAHAEVLALRSKAFKKRMEIDRKSFNLFMEAV